ncbi:MAG TPA: hypothetical protein DEP72_01580 [Clostridiales bacterium]|nr:MAG: hypothetical protein A2Y18_07495 [Clostridiales bacterium GWD2_32_19]HCC06844.1 hypothetical protein [Clostridiales bacterium]
MEHIIFMNKKTDDFLKRIVTGEKPIESRWYKHKYAPWDRIKAGETVYFKNSGEKVTVRAVVKEIMQFENLDEEKIEKIWNAYGKEINPITKDMKSTIGLEKAKPYKYCVLVWVKDVKEIEPFAIDKTGYGNMAAWIVVDDVNKIRVK